VNRNGDRSSLTIECTSLDFELLLEISKEVAKIYMEEHTVAGDHCIAGVAVTQTEYIRSHQIAHVRASEVVLSVAVLLAQLVMFPKVHLESFVVECTHAATIASVNAGVVIGILNDFNVADHIVHGKHSVDGHLEVISRIQPDVVHEFENLEGELVLPNIIA
jgi:hypothetical protein